MLGISLLNGKDDISVEKEIKIDVQNAVDKLKKTNNHLKDLRGVFTPLFLCI